MSYSLILTSHITLVLISGAFFVLRGIWMLQNNPTLQAKPVRVAPHIIDTLLLVTGFVLAYHLSAYPFGVDWLTAKLLLLVAYIGLGVVALRRGKTKLIRSIALVAALTVYLFMLSIALNKSPWGLLAGLA